MIWWRSFLYSSSVSSCHLFLISSVFVRPIQFLSFIVLIFAGNIPLVSLVFLKRSLVFPILFFPLFLCTDHRGSLSYLSLLFFGTLHANGYNFHFLLCLSLLFFSQLFIRPPQTTICFFEFLFMRIVLINGSYTMSWMSVHSSLGTLSIRSNLLNLFVTSTV